MRHLKTAWKHTRRTPYQALAAVLVMTLTLFIASIFTLMALGSEVILRHFETRPQVTAFFSEGVGVEKIEALKTKLEETGKVAQVKYVSKEEALAIYKEQNKNDPLLLEMVTANILPASLEASPTDLVYLQEIAQILQKEEGVEEVVFQQDIVDALAVWTKSLRIIGIALVSSLAVVSFLTILIIIAMKVALRQGEIEILRLIGASSWYVRAPFVWEGTFYGVAGAVAAWVLAYILLLYTTPFLVSFLAGVPLFPISPLVMLALLGGLTVVGAVIGALSSFLAVRRYLHR